MKPEDCFDQHVNRGSQIVAPANVAQFVRENGVDLLRREALRDAMRQQEYRSKDAENAGLQQGRRGQYRHVQFQMRGRCTPDRGLDATPAYPPDTSHNQESADPE